MADNYLEKKFEDMRARQRAWKKRMDAYRKKIEEASKHIDED